MRSIFRRRGLRLAFVALLPWLLTFNIRYVFGEPQAFGELQYLEYTRYILPLSALTLLAGIFLFFRPGVVSALINRSILLRYSSLAALFFLIASTIASINRGLSLYWVAMLAIYACGTIYITAAFRSDRGLFRIFFYSLLGTLFFQAGLGIYQIAAGHSLGLTLLGEQPTTDASPGVAKLLINGAKILRPYGTFLHSNTYGGFIVVVLLATIARAMSIFSTRGRRTRNLIDFGQGIPLIALLLSYSRSAWIAFTAGFAYLATTSRQTISSMRVPLAVLIISVVIGLPGILGRFQIGQQ